MGEPTLDRLRPPEEVMELGRLGVAWPTRFSFSHNFLRHVAGMSFSFQRVEISLDDRGRGRAVYRVEVDGAILTFVVFSHLLRPEEQQDRIIATRWDAWAALFLGDPDESDLEKSRVEVQKVVWGRAAPGTVTWSRANRSTRLFEHMVSCLAEGHQPDPVEVNKVGYLIRTTGFSGNGRNGMLDYAYLRSVGHPLRAPYHMQMMAAYLWREFGSDLVEHMARVRSARAVPLSPDMRRFIGIGNSSGIGLVPFVVRHPRLLDRWIGARERALAAVCSEPFCAEDERSVRYAALIDRAKAYFRDEPSGEIEEFSTPAHIVAELDRAARLYTLILREWVDRTASPNPVAELIATAADSFEPELQELIVALALELIGGEVIPEELHADERLDCPPDLTCGTLLSEINTKFDWVYSHSHKGMKPYFWYASEENMEPRRGLRGYDEGDEFELPVDILGRLNDLRAVLADVPPETTIGRFVFCHPDMQFMVRWTHTLASLPYSVARMDLLAPDYAPLRIMRFQLATYGMMKFRPRSQTMLRATILQGAALPEELARGDAGDGLFPVFPAWEENKRYSKERMDAS